MMELLTPSAAVSVLIYACALGLLLLPVWFVGSMLTALRAYAPPPFARVLKSTPLPRGRWRFRFMWHGRVYAVEGFDDQWRHVTSGRSVRSPARIAFLRQHFEALAQLPIAEPIEEPPILEEEVLEDEPIRISAART